jgi:hypothetical protein
MDDSQPERRNAEMGLVLLERLVQKIMICFEL